VDPRTRLDDLEERKFLTLPGLELQPLGHPARSQSLYRLPYPGFVYNNRTKLIEDRVLLQSWLESRMKFVFLSLIFIVLPFLIL
jgi:hypothetical protein